MFPKEKISLPSKKAKNIGSIKASDRDWRAQGNEEMLVKGSKVPCVKRNVRMYVLSCMSL